MELYANWGLGFHSNDARGVVNNVTPVPGLVKGEGYEAGMRFEFGSFNITATQWWLDLASELIFVGDSNAVEPKTGAKRRGYELVAFWKPMPWLGLDLTYTHSRARYKAIQDDPDYDAGDPQFDMLQGRFVEGGVESAGSFGAAAVKGRWEISTRAALPGPLPAGAQWHETRGFRSHAEPARGLQAGQFHAVWRSAECARRRWQGYRVLLPDLRARRQRSRHAAGNVRVARGRAANRTLRRQILLLDPQTQGA